MFEVMLEHCSSFRLRNKVGAIAKGPGSLGFFEKPSNDGVLPFRGTPHGMDDDSHDTDGYRWQRDWSSVRM
jgi:hypothetical protein